MESEIKVKWKAVAAEAKKLPSTIPVVTTDDLYAKIDYQPLTLATGVGRLHFVKVAGHAGIPLNERVDQLARDAITRRGSTNRVV